MALQPPKEKMQHWEKGQKCEIYCQINKQLQWVKGEVVDVFNDDDGEWVKVKYGKKRIEVLSDSNDIRILSKEKEPDDHGWSVGSQCEVYIREKGKWAEGEVINTFTDEDGYCIRIQYGQRVRDVAPMNIAHDLRARGTSHLAVTLDEFKKLKTATTKTAIEKVLKRIFANSERFVFEDGGKSSVSHCSNWFSILTAFSNFKVNHSLSPQRRCCVHCKSFIEQTEKWTVTVSVARCYHSPRGLLC